MSLLRVNRIAPRTGSTITIDGILFPEDTRATDGSFIVSEAEMDAATNVSDTIQAELDEGGVDGGDIKTVRLGSGTGVLNKPLLMMYNDQRLVSGASGTTTLTTNGFYGPAIVMTPPEAQYPIPVSSPALATGAGGSWEFDATSSAFLSLLDVPPMRINGLAAFTLQFFLRVDDLDNTRELFVSYGKRLNYDASTHSAFRLYVDTSGNVAGYLNVSGVEKSFTIGTIVADTIYHIELGFNGSTIYPFLDGTLGSTVAAAGTISQAKTEDFIMGRRPRDWPEAGSAIVTQDCRVDSVHFSNAIRHTSSFATPTAKHTADASTILLLNFASEYGTCLVGTNGASRPCYLVVRREFNSVLLFDQEVVGITIDNDNGIGILACQTIKVRLNDVRVLGGNPWGIARLHNCFSWRTTDVYVNGNDDGSGAYWCGQATGAGLQRRTEIEGGVYQLVCSEGADDEYQGLFIGPSTSTIISAIFKGEGSGGHITTTSMLIDQENLGGNWEAAVVFSKIDGFCIIGGDLEGQDMPAIIVDDIKRGIIVGPRMTCGSASAVIQIETPPTSPIEIYEPLQRFGGSVAWVDAADADHVVIHAFGQAEQGIYDAGNSGTTKTITSTNGKRQKLTATGNCTVTLTLSEGHEIELHWLTGAGSFTGAFGTVTWMAGSAPTITATATKLDVLRFWKTNAKLYGQVLGQNLTP